MLGAALAAPFFFGTRSGAGARGSDSPLFEAGGRNSAGARHRVVIQECMWATRLIAGVLVLSGLCVGSAQAKKKPSYSTGVLAGMQSVSCGYMQKSGPTLAGALITGAEHSKSRELLCQEYTLKTDRVTYRIRPKEEKHPALLPVGEEAEFRLRKDQMLLRIPESDNKEREYFVVSMAPTEEFASEIENTRRPPKPHGKALKGSESAPGASGGNEQQAARVAATPAPATASGPETSSQVAIAAPPVPPSAGAAVQQAASLQVESSPPGADIYVDSAIAGRTPALLTLKPGAHSIQVVMPGYKDWVTNVSVTAGAQQQISATLAR